jgi:alanine racemase
LYGARDASVKVGRKARIHLELETGMNRTGITEEDLVKAIDFINDNQECFLIDGICTHFAGAESIANYVRIKNQIEKYKILCGMLSANRINPKFNHTASSAASLTYPETRMDLVRIGIAQYGFWPSRETKMYNQLTNKKTYKSDPLTRVLRWSSQIMDVKNVKAGKFVSYGTSYLTEKETKIALIPVGYSHGYSRSLSNLGSVLIRNKKVSIIGMVNMNMIIANVTNLPGVQKGDEVVLIGKQGNQYISVASFSELSQNVNYEMLTRLPKDIPRIIVN